MTKIINAGSKLTKPDENPKPPALFENAATQILKYNPIRNPNFEIKKTLSASRLFAILVLLPTLITAFYMYAIAADQYRSEAMFVIKAADKQNISGIGALLQQTGLSTSFSNSSAVVEYLKSRDALRAIDKDGEYKSSMTVDSADILARYPSPLSRDNFENLYSHYLTKTKVLINPTTDIIELRVNAFTAESAQNLALKMMGAARSFISQLNASLQTDALATAKSSVLRAEENLITVQQRLSALRSTREIIDPTIQVKGDAEITLALTEQLLNLDLRIAALKDQAEAAPQLKTLNTQRKILKQNLDAQKSSRVIGDDGKFVSTIDSFSRLKLEQEFAAKALSAARASYETARLDTIRQQVYLVSVVEPNKPDDSLYPERFSIVMTVFAILLGIFTISWLFLANLREHAE